MNTVDLTTMKTSEFIRNAVDAHLSTDGVDKIDHQVDAFICNALRHYKHSIDIYAASPKAYENAKEIIEQELLEYQQQRRATITCTTIGNVLEHELSGEELQAFRFMYAEMLAYYFDSIGD